MGIQGGVRPRMVRDMLLAIVGVCVLGCAFTLGLFVFLQMAFG